MAKKFDFLSPGVEIREIDQSYLPIEVEAEGPIIIGRTRKGPANKPVKIRSLDDFVSVFGAPIPGGAGVQGDMWRDGNTSGPTYASYAAQAWLASEESPVTMVRVAGEKHPDSDSNGIQSGWNISAAPTTDAATNKTAYGLFLIASSSTNTDQTGSLAAVLYCTEGAITLANGASSYLGAGLVASTGDNHEFQIGIHPTSGDPQRLTVNFDRNSSKYIRSVLNTNPQLTNTATTPTAQQKTYWLGETFAREVSSLPSSSAGTVYGMIVPLESGSVNWSDHNHSAQEAETGWIFSQAEKGKQKLFKLKTLHVGEDIQRNYMISIEDIAEPANPVVNPFGSFSVVIRDSQGTSIERYSGCNLNPSSNDYIAKRIGDQYMTWSETNRRYRTLGNYQNQSNIVYVQMMEFINDGGGQGLLPAGFYGPVRPKGFSIVSGSETANGFGSDHTSAFAGAFIEGSGSTYGATDNLEFVTSVTDFTGSFSFPSIPLRQNGTEGGAPDPYRAMWGIRPKISSTSNQHDPDYCDYLRILPVGVDSFDASGDFEYSIEFTLDDLVILTGSNSVTYTKDSWVDGTGATGTSFTDKSGSFGELLDLGVRQFMMPLWGGFEGWDITEKEPMRHDLIADTRNDVGNYIHYSLFKAIDSAADPEVVPANLILAPGIRKPIITNKILDVAAARKDVLAIIDIEDDYKPAAERRKEDGESASLGSVTTAISTAKQRNLDTSYGCAFYPWVQIADNLNGGNLVWVPPSVAALGAFGRSQAQSELWFAPAGFNRGGLGSLGGPRGPKVIQARQRLDSKERDSLYEININPIATFPAEGVVIFGQKTLQASPSALDRINVRRLVLFLKSEVSKISRNLLFDQNVESTWRRFKAQTEPVLSSTKSRFGLSDYKLILDETTTTADLVDRNIMYAKIYIKPARALEYIVVDFVITRTGADFV